MVVEVFGPSSKVSAMYLVSSAVTVAENPGFCGKVAASITTAAVAALMRLKTECMEISPLYQTPGYLPELQGSSNIVI